jgi:uncharacterized Tic20 family protein
MEITIAQEKVDQVVVQKNDKSAIDFQLALPFYLCALLIVGVVCLSILSSNAAKQNGIVIQSTNSVNFPL